MARPARFVESPEEEAEDMEEEVEQAEEEIEQEEEAEEEESPHVVIVLKAASGGAQGNWKAARLELRPDDDGLFSLASLKACSRTMISTTSERG